MLFFSEREEKLKDSEKVRLVLDNGFDTNFIHELEKRNLAPIFDSEDLFRSFNDKCKAQKFSQVDFEKIYQYFIETYKNRTSFEFYIITESLLSEIFNEVYDSIIEEDNFDIWIKRLQLKLNNDPMSTFKIVHIDFNSYHVVFADTSNIRSEIYYDLDAIVYELHELAGH